MPVIPPFAWRGTSLFLECRVFALSSSCIVCSPRGCSLMHRRLFRKAARLTNSHLLLPLQLFCLTSNASSHDKRRCIYRQEVGSEDDQGGSFVVQLMSIVGATAYDCPACRIEPVQTLVRHMYHTNSPCTRWLLWLRRGAGWRRCAKCTRRFRCTSPPSTSSQR